MSAFSQALSQLIDAEYDGKNVNFTRRVGVSQSVVGRWLSTEYRPRRSAVRKLAKKLPKINALGIILAHLYDECPVELRPDIVIAPVKSRAGRAAKPPSTFEQLDADTLSLLEWCASKARDSEPFRELLQAQVKLLQAAS